MGTVHAKSLGNDDDASNAVDLVGIKAHVQRVHIDGLCRTQNDIVINSVRDLFSASDLRSVILRVHEARMRLEGLGCFNSVGVVIDTFDGETALDDGIEVTFHVKELKLTGASLQTSVGNNEGTVTTSGTLRNLFGRGEQLSSEYAYGSKKSSSFHTMFKKPFHNEVSTELSTGVYQEASEAPWSGYKELNRGALIGLAFSTAPQVKQKLILDSVWRHISCLSRTTAFAVREHSGHSLKSAIKHELNLDKRDDNIFPTDGIFLQIRNEFAGLGSDIGFLKNEVDLQVNLPILESLVIQGSLRSGHMLPLRNNKWQTISDKFVLGGPSSIRGFEIAGIGPQSDGVSLGAEMFWAAALHAYIPLPLLERKGTFSERFRIHAFVNTGNIGDFVLTHNNRLDLKSLFKDMRVSYGAGLALNLAGLARVELNYCIPLLFQRGDRPSQGLQFGISTSFL